MARKIVDPRRVILTRVNAAGQKALRQLALDRDMTLQALVIEALNDMLAKHRRGRVIEAGNPPGRPKAD